MAQDLVWKPGGGSKSPPGGGGGYRPVPDTGMFRPLGIWIRRLYDLAATLDHLGHLDFA